MGGGNVKPAIVPVAGPGLSPRGRGKPVKVLRGGLSLGSIPAWAGETHHVLVLVGERRVYPRVGGGNDHRGNNDPSSRGLSPRGRGKRPKWTAARGGRRSIPAWAGETWPPSLTGRDTQVYPRVGGGNPPGDIQGVNATGLSPRGRGKLSASSCAFAVARSIPAWAGETPYADILAAMSRVYPRVGGGNILHCWDGGGVEGLSPRGRGKLHPAVGQPQGRGSIPAWAGETPALRHRRIQQRVYPRVGGGNDPENEGQFICNGLSPRGRGKPPPTSPRGTRTGSIPAWAGETAALAAPSIQPTVYPRVGGGNQGHPLAFQDVAGLSPRGRGKLHPISDPGRQTGSIPAWAGETFAHGPGDIRKAVYPRVGGGNRARGKAIGPTRGLSPRGRGKLRLWPRYILCLRSIPAWAGETCGSQRLQGAGWVYPRVGGGNGRRQQQGKCLYGLSPRGRGKLGRHYPWGFCNRSIPAWAGETGTHALISAAR